jgi:hypothetical protein
MVIGSVMWLRLGCVNDEFVAYVSRAVSHVTPLVDVPNESIELEVLVGDGAELGRVGDVVARLTPSRFVAGVMVEVGFDPVGGVAPDRPGHQTGGNRTE